MQILFIIIFSLVSIASFWQFIRGKFKLSPLWLMLSAWFIVIAISQLHLSSLELVWPVKYWFLIFVSLASFALGVLVFEKIWQRYPWWQKIRALKRETFSVSHLRLVIYFLFLISCIALYLFYRRAGAFPLLAPDSDAFRFIADQQVPGLINYCAQLARIFIPLSFFLFFYENTSSSPRIGEVRRGREESTKSTTPSPSYSRRGIKHLNLVLICLLGTISLVLFASRTQIFFIDLWVMALYLLMRKPSWKQALKFYPIFLLISILVLAAVPLIRQYRSYGPDYLAHVTGIDTSNSNLIQKALVPIYVGISFNQQALLHAENYYQTHQLQYGKVSLDPFTNLFGKIIKPLNKFKSHYDLSEIFYSWWNTGTYLFPFVQDFGTSAFYFVPFLIAGIMTLLWRYCEASPNFLSLNLYAYACFFIVMTVYLSFTVRAEMYIDLALLFGSYLYVSRYES